MDITHKSLRAAMMAMALGITVVITGCASSGPNAALINGTSGSGGAGMAEPEAMLIEAAPGQTVSISSINVVGDGDRVLIDTEGTVRYTVFRLSDPPRLIVDMPEVSLDELSGPMAVGNDFITEISSTTYGGEESIGRITIGLKDGIDHEVKAGEDSILVSLKKNVYVSGFSSDGTVAKATANLSEMEAVEAPAPAAIPTVAELEQKMASSLAPATMLVSLEAMNLGASTVVTIKADGAVGNYNAFELDDPSRIVVDVWGVKSTMPDNHVNVGDDNVKAVRIGNHLDKARLVFDSEGAVPPAHSIVKSGDSIVVTIGETPAESVSTAGQLAYAEPLDVISEDTAAEAAFEGDAPVAEAAPEILPLWDNPPAMSADEAAPAQAVSEKVAVVEPLAEETVPAYADAAPESAMAADEPAVMEDSVPEPVMAAPAAPAEIQAPVLSIRTVDFRKLPDRAVLTVEASGQTAFNITESKDGTTLAIDVRNSVIPASLSRTLDATRLDTPVVSISSYQEAVAPEKVVRVLVRLKKDALYEVSEAGGALIIDFPDTAAAMAAKAGEAVVEGEAVSVMSVTGKEYTGKRIDLDMTDANIRDILRLMAEVSDLNIIAADDVIGTVSLRLKDVPWDQAFDIILKSRGLDSIEEGNVVRVAPAATIRQERESKVASVKAEEKLEETKLEFLAINYADAATLVTHVTNVLSDRGSVTSEERTNTLIIKDITKGIEAARNLVNKLDTQIPQVLIEARIVEATSSFARDLGIQWGVDYQNAGRESSEAFGSTTTTGQTPPASTDPPVFTTRHGAGNYAVNLPATGSAGTLGALGFIFGRAGANPFLLDLRLTAGEQQGRLKTISRPRVTTLDNKEAKIEQGESIPFETSSAAGTATTFIDANLSLTVTPHITPDGSVLMQIKASRNSIGTYRTASGEPSINKKEASTEVLVRDGETTVIGGIVVSDSTHTDRGIPLLKNIPVVGWLFKNKSISDTQTELLIFLTPTIMKEQVVG